VNDVNARGLFFVMQASARRMMQQSPSSAGRPRGKIINTASIAGRGGRPMFAAYAASKAAAISITQSAAMALAPHVTVNALCPGVVDTEMWKQIDREWTQIDQRPSGSAWQDRFAASRWDARRRRTISPAWRCFSRARIPITSPGSRTTSTAGW
jgi:meso-butanediol dehydrogenase/(S,S)-butanediol dehydrogenase/diacetyl reductase